MEEKEGDTGERVREHEQAPMRRVPLVLKGGNNKPHHMGRLLIETYITM